MGYDKGKKGDLATQPVITDEKKARRYKVEIENNLGVIKSQKAQLESIQSEKATIKEVLDEQYDKHKVEVANLYNDLGRKKKAFEIECETVRADLAARQAALDEQATQLETTAISIADDKKHLIEKENELIHLSNETIGRDQANSNKETYLGSLKAALEAQKVEIRELKEHLDLQIEQHAAIIEKKEALSRDLDIKIRQHDARVDEVNAHIKEMKKHTAEYQRAQADAFIMQEKKDQHEQAVKENQNYAAQLKRTDESLMSRENQVTVREKAAQLRDRDMKRREQNLKELEKRGGSLHG